VWRRILNAVVGPPFRWFLRKLPALDPWEELAFGFALERYGDGVQYDFPRYLNGPSTVRVHSVDDVQGWLSGCSFKTDNEHFGQDHWLSTTRSSFGDSFNPTWTIPTLLLVRRG
jgi:hypothetical protein